jgi:hypothetical protein
MTIGTRRYSYLSSGSRQALREVSAPPDVDTLRDTQCPVCSATDSFQGDTCSVCNAPRPPRNLMAPDTSRARDIERITDGDPGQVGEGIDPSDPDDIGQDDPDADPDADGVDEYPEDPSDPLGDDEDPLGDDEGDGDLVCPVCGSSFPSADNDDLDGQPHLDAAADTEPLMADPEADPRAEQDMAETAYESGDQCPVCGEGSLQPEDDIAADDDEGPEEDEEYEDDDPTDGDEDPADEDQPPPFGRRR